MAANRQERTGVLVVRAWVEPRRDGGDLRARITYRVDLSAEEETVRVAASRAQVVDTVTAWLDELAGPSPGDGDVTLQ